MVRVMQGLTADAPVLKTMTRDNCSIVCRRTRSYIGYRDKAGRTSVAGRRRQDQHLDRPIDPLCWEQTAEEGYTARARYIEKQAGGPRRTRGTLATPRETTAAVRAPGQDGDVGGLSLTSV